MGSEADAEAASASAVDSDGSVSWEDFFGKLNASIFCIHKAALCTFCRPPVQNIIMVNHKL